MSANSSNEGRFTADPTNFFRTWLATNSICKKYRESKYSLSYFCIVTFDFYSSYFVSDFKFVKFLIIWAVAAMSTDSCDSFKSKL